MQNQAEENVESEFKVKTSAEELVNGIIKLVSLPHVCIRVNLMVDDPSFSNTDIGDVISQDASLTVRLLKVANSSFFGYQSKIETVSRAVTIIGSHELSTLVLAVSAVRSFSNIPIDLANMASFWRHSMFCGIVARLIAARCNVLHTERLFVGGLLHDLGQLILFHKLPDLSRQMLHRIELTDEESHLVEESFLGFNHGDVGAELMKLWELPATLQNSIKYHHCPSEAEDDDLESSILHLANTITQIAEMEHLKEVYVDRIDPYAWKRTKLDKEIIDGIIEEAHPLLFDGLALIMPNE